MKIISLTNSDKVALVDDENWLEFALESWYLDTNGYVRQTNRSHKNMHSILGKRLGYKQTDHRIKHDNQKSNLREATTSQNQANSKKQNNKSSKYKGVIWNKREQKWTAQIRFNKQRHHLGYFLIEEEAALEYNIYAKIYFGEFAVLNEVNL